MFLVTSGPLTATVGSERVAAFGPGAMIGEMGFLTGNPRSASVKADVPSTLAEFANFDGLPTVLRERLYKRIAVVLAGRLGATTKSLVASIG
jgi:CRP-like cAMP-binding protein